METARKRFVAFVLPRSGYGLQTGVAALRGYVGSTAAFDKFQPQSGCSTAKRLRRCEEGRNRFAVEGYF